MSTTPNINSIVGGSVKLYSFMLEEDKIAKQIVNVPTNAASPGFLLNFIIIFDMIYKPIVTLYYKGYRNMHTKFISFVILTFNRHFITWHLIMLVVLDHTL